MVSGCRQTLDFQYWLKGIRALLPFSQVHDTFGLGYSLYGIAINL